MIPQMKQVPEWKGRWKSANESVDDPFNQSEPWTSWFCPCSAQPGKRLFTLLFCVVYVKDCIMPILSPQWEAADAEIKVPSGENIGLKRSPFKAWSRSVYSHTCYAYCQGFLPCLFLHCWSIHVHFIQNLSRFFLCWLWLTHGSCVGPQNKIGLPAWGRFPCWAPAEYK